MALLPKSIHHSLEGLGLKKAYLDALDRLIGRIDPVAAGVEAGLIIALGLSGFLLRRRIRRVVGTLIGIALPPRWAEGTARALDSVSLPLFWLTGLWLASLIASLLDVRTGLADAAASLLAAWVTIRLLSFAVRNPVLSAGVSIIAWSMAALSILGLMHPMAAQLDSMAFTLGRMHISLLTVLRALMMLGLLLWATTLVSSYLERQISRSDSLTPSLQALLIRLLNLFLPGLAALIALEAVGIDLTALTVLSGAIGIGVGLGLQKSVSNLVAGLTLILGKTIKPGDVVAYRDTYGWVTSMGARFVAIATRDGSEFLVPNEEFISNGVENWSYTNNLRRLHVPFMVAYESDMHQVIAVALAAAQSVSRILPSPEPVCLMMGLGESGVNFEVRCWINDPQNGVTNAKSAVLLALWDALKANRIEVPYPRRDIRLVAGPGATIPPLSAGPTGP